MVCGMSSWLVQVTVVPTFTVSAAGAKVKLSIVMLVLSACAGALPSEKEIAAAMARRPRLRRSVQSMTKFPLARQRRVDDGEALVAGLEVDAGDAEQGAQL